MRPQRGFFILIVLVVLAILSAAVIAQFASTSNNEVISVRSADDAKARAVAEGCLSLLQQFADAEIGLVPGPIASGKDFDELLNPNLSPAISGDEYYPAPDAAAGEAAVFLPAGIPTLPQDFSQRHRWLLMPRTVGSGATAERGACLVRFDDNSDEALPIGQLPVGAVDKTNAGVPFEGPTVGSEVTFMDRDRAIYMTAIGIFPFLPSTSAPNAYARAHARVTLRRLYNAGGQGAGGGSAILSGGDVSGIKGSVCGGGITADTFAIKGSPFRGGGCGCGVLEYSSVPPIPGQCSSCPVPCTNVTGAVVPPGPPNLATRVANALAGERPPGNWAAAFNLFDSESFGPPPAPGTAMPLTPNDLGALDLAGGTTASCKLVYTNRGGVGEVFVWDRLDPAPAGTPGDNCTSYSSAVVGEPCTWGGAGAGTLTSCAGTETGCWKRVASGTPLTWSPDAGADIPNTATAGLRWGAPLGASYLCGDPTPAASCANCNGANNAGSWDGSAWSFNTVTDGDLPVPSYVVVKNATPADTTTITKPGFGSNKPLHVSIASNSSIDVGGPDWGLCGAACDCSGIGDEYIGACGAPAAGVVATLAAAPTCYAIRTARAFTNGAVGSGSTIVGAVRAGTVQDTSAKTCYVGNIAAMSIDAVSSTCGASICQGRNQLCWDGDSNVFGNMFADGHAILRGRPVLNGTLAATGDFCARTSGRETINGRMIAGGDVVFKGGGPEMLAFSGGAAGVGNIVALRSMMETAW